MKWKKIKQLFVFNESPFKDRFISHAQSPQAVVFDNFIRIYFTTRIKDSEKTFISIPQYIDYTQDFQKILDYSKQEIIKQGEISCFDEHGIFPFSPYKENDKIYAYTTGWTRRISVSTDTAIGYCESSDNGKNFHRIANGPILAASLYEPFLICDGFIIKENNHYYMFYCRGKKWCEPTKEHDPERVYKISYAYSTDKINWTKSNIDIISNIIDDNECQALPTVFKYNNIYHMYFCYRSMLDFRKTKTNAYKLGYAYSHNLTDWIRDDTNAGISLSEYGWDSQMQCYPNVFEMNNNFYMLYNGNDFGKNGFGLAILKKE